MKPEDILAELDEDELRENFIKYTIRAFQILPELDKPRILDIACGSGMPTIMLAKLSGGEVVGIDIDQPSLDKLNEKIVQEGLTARVKAVNCSMLKIDFPDESFDILWAEGVGCFIGFEKALKLWRRLLKPDGFLIIHDDLKGLENKLEQIPSCGYGLLDHFQLPEEAWWVEYFEPLGERIEALRAKYKDSSEINRILDGKSQEVDSAKNNIEDNRSAFFIMQKL